MIALLLAAAMALVVSLLITPVLMSGLRRRGIGQLIREEGPAGHHGKAGTPTMGGLLILSALLFSTLVWARLDDPFVWITLLVTLAAGIALAYGYGYLERLAARTPSGRRFFAWLAG